MFVMLTSDYPQDFRELLLQLFYAAAQADGVVQEEEKEALLHEVKYRWKDVMSSDEAKVSISKLEEKFTDVETTLEELKSFKKEHESFFTDTLVERLMDSVSAIVSAFAQRNKSEVVLLSQLHFILRKK